MEREEWREVLDYEGLYLISNKGRVKNLRHGLHWSTKEYISMFPDCDGYLRVHLRRDNKTKMYGVHLLVAQAFNGRRPIGMVVNHKDGNKLNNDPSNLEYVTNAENIKHAARLGLMPRGDRHSSVTKPEKVPRGSKHGMSKINEEIVRRIKAELTSGRRTQKEIANIYGCCVGTVNHISTGRQWKHVTL